MHTNEHTSTLVSIREFSRMHPTFSEASLRWYVRNAGRYGLEGVVIRVGRRVLIDGEGFFTAITQKNREQE